MHTTATDSSAGNRPWVTPLWLIGRIACWTLASWPTQAAVAENPAEVAMVAIPRPLPVVSPVRASPRQGQQPPASLSLSEIEFSTPREPNRDQASQSAEGGPAQYLDSATACAADETSQLTQRMDALEQNYVHLSEDYQSLQNDYHDLKSALKGLVHPGHGAATMKIGGRIHLDDWAFPASSPGIDQIATAGLGDGPQDRFGIRRARFGVQGDLCKTVQYKIEMEFAAGVNTEFRDLFIGTKDLPILRTVLVGNQKRPYGLDHLNSSRFNVMMERPFIVEAFNQDSRRLGIASYGDSENQAWNWRYGVYNMRLIQDEGNYTSDHYQLEFAGRLANTFWYDETSNGRGYAHWAISGTYARPDGNAPPLPLPGGNEAEFRTRPEARTRLRWLNTGPIAGADHYGLLGAESLLNLGPLQWVGEYQHVWLGRDPRAGRDLHFHGGYFYVSYFLTGEHMPWNRQRGVLGRPDPVENFFLVDTCRDGIHAGWGAWQIAARWSYADLTDDEIEGGVGQSGTLGLNWYWNAYTRMQLNYLYGDIRARGRALADGQTSGFYQIVGLRFMVDF